MPEFAEAFSKEHPDLLPQSEDKLKALFDSKMGTLIRMLAFSLKGRTTEVSHNIRSLELIESPFEILDVSTKNGKRIYDHFQEINKHYEKVIKDAIKKAGKEKVLLYTYPSTKHSFTGNLSNELISLDDKMGIFHGRSFYTDGWESKRKKVLQSQQACFLSVHSHAH